jgi:hypothetical protein
MEVRFVPGIDITCPEFIQNLIFIANHKEQERDYML